MGHLTVIAIGLAFAPHQENRSIAYLPWAKVNNAYLNISFCLLFTFFPFLPSPFLLPSLFPLTSYYFPLPSFFLSFSVFLLFSLWNSFFFFPFILCFCHFLFFSYFLLFLLSLFFVFFFPFISLFLSYGTSFRCFEFLKWCYLQKTDLLHHLYSPSLSAVELNMRFVTLSS